MRAIRGSACRASLPESPGTSRIAVANLTAATTAAGDSRTGYEWHR